MIRITYQDDTTVELDEIPYSTLVGFERKFGVSVRKFMEEERAEWLAWCAWHALGAAGDFEEFVVELKKITTNEVGEAGEAPSSPTPS